MGLLSFQLPRVEDLDRPLGTLTGYVTGLDRTPVRTHITVDEDRLRCHRETHESGRLVLSWPVPNAGYPMVSTATLAERGQTYHLALELARGKLNDVRNQLADWVHLGLQGTDPVRTHLETARKALTRCALSSPDPSVSLELAQRSMDESFQAADILIDLYVDQVLSQRTADRPLSTRHGFVIDESFGEEPWVEPLCRTANTVRLSCPWKQLAPDEGRLDWSALDAQLDWARRRGFEVACGPLIEFSPSGFPDWLWLWEGDSQTIQSMAIDMIRQAVTRYRGQFTNWHLVHRPAVDEVLGLSPMDQVSLTVRGFQVARQHAPETPLILDLDRPWAEWLTNSEFQLGPLHLAHDLARADLGLAGIGLEIAPGYSAPGSHLRDLFDYSRLLDFYSLLNLPLHINLVLPSDSTPDSNADPQVRVMNYHWPESPTCALQSKWAMRWIALTAAKHFVRTIYWAQPSDTIPHLYPHGGLVDLDGQPKPLLTEFQKFIQRYFG